MYIYSNLVFRNYEQKRLVYPQVHTHTHKYAHKCTHTHTSMQNDRVKLLSLSICANGINSSTIVQVIINNIMTTTAIHNVQNIPKSFGWPKPWPKNTACTGVEISQGVLPQSWLSLQPSSAQSPNRPGLVSSLQSPRPLPRF